jgi:maleamate amidohydrolase
VVDGFAYNFRCLVPHDAVYDRCAASHAVNLFDMAAKYADDGTTAEIVEKLRPLAKSSCAVRKVG